MNIHNIGDQPAIPQPEGNLPVPTGKPWFHSRTVWAGVLGLLIAILALPEVGTIVPSGWLPYFYMLSSILGILLRFVTGQPIGR